VALKIVIFYNSGSQGFSEVYYTPDNNPTVILESAWDNVFSKGILFRAKPCTLFACRATNYNGPNGTFTRPLSQRFYIPAEDEDTPATTSNDAVWTLKGIGGKSRNVSLRGLEDTAIARDVTGQDLLDATVNKLMRNYFSALADAGVGIKYQSKADPMANPEFQIQSIAAGPQPTQNSVITLFQAIPGGWAAGTPLIFHGIPTDDAPGFPKYCKAIAVNAPNPQEIIVPYRLRSQATVFPRNMRVRQSQFSYDAFKNGTAYFIRFSERKTGRAFGALRGRSRAAVTRQ